MTDSMILHLEDLEKRYFLMFRGSQSQTPYRTSTNGVLTF